VSCVTRSPTLSMPWPLRFFGIGDVCGRRTSTRRSSGPAPTSGLTRTGQALLLIRIIETTTGDTWNNIRRHLDRLHVGTFTGPAGTFRPRTHLTQPQRDLLAKLAITPPKQIVELEPARHPRRPSDRRDTPLWRATTRLPGHTRYRASRPAELRRTQVKRQMYGRAGFELLRKRVILHPA